jgi:hypothetical protein
MEIKGLYSKREILAIAKKIKAAAYEPIENSVIKQDELIRDHSVMADDNLWK